MNVACISTSRIPSDTANSIQVMKACHGIARLGHSVRLMAPGSAMTGWDNLAERYGLSQPFEIHWLPAYSRLKNNDFALRAVLAARQSGAGLIYTWTGQSAVFALMLGLPVIFEAHDRSTGHFGPRWFQLFRILPGRKRLAPITRALRRVLEQGFGSWPDEQVVIAPNGVDLEQYANLPDAITARRSLGLPEGFTVSCSGHLYAGRGVELFLELARRFPALRFLWIGGRPEDVAYWRDQACGCGLDNVQFAGFIDQRRLPIYQAASEVLLMPYARVIAGSGGGNSADICSPMKMFDYLAAGRAILSSDLPVIHEVLNTDNARFAEPENAEDWAAGLRRLVEQESLRRQLGEQARKDAAAYSWQERAHRVLAGF